MSQLEVNKIVPQSGTSLTYGDNGDTFQIPSGVTLDIASGGTIDATGATITGFDAASDEKVKISSNDTTPGFLNGKLVAGTGISLTEGSDGGDETLTIASTATAAITGTANGANNRVATYSAATTLNGEANLTYDGSKLGINIASPTRTVHIHDDTQPYLHMTNNTTGTATGDGFDIIVDASTGKAILNQRENQPIEWMTNNTVHMNLDGSGNLSLYKGVLRLQNSTTGTSSSDGLLLEVSGNDCYFNLKESASIFFRTNNTDRMKIDSQGSLIPTTNNSVDLGATDAVWRNIYTSDLNMTNEYLDKGNDVDGTKGSWTFQEGSDDLFLLNNKNGKKYKFKLEECR